MGQSSCKVKGMCFFVSRAAFPVSGQPLCDLFGLVDGGYTSQDQTMLTLPKL